MGIQNPANRTFLHERNYGTPLGTGLDFDSS
jgi:hypothetical protein